MYVYVSSFPKICLTLLVVIEKRSEHRLKKEIFVFVKNILLTGLLLVFSMNFPRTTWKIDVLAIIFPTENQNQIHYFQNLKMFSWEVNYKILTNSLIKQIFPTEATSVSLFWGGMISNRLKTLLWKLGNNKCWISLLSCRWSQSNTKVCCNTYIILPLTSANLLIQLIFELCKDTKRP